MGDLRAGSPEANGAVLEERPTTSSSLLSSNQTAIAAEYWRTAEAATQGIIASVQPTLVSEERRKVVIDYVQRLIRNFVGCEVYPFGSVPLITYLPDGDIDLTVFGGMNNEEALANEVCSVLEREDQNKAAEFVVKDVQLIRAEVKLVKCLVQNIVVDISFNQLGGLCTLCFLEEVDHLIGKEHLFKRSIILIKAWCYYESRILGAHHGLISTYALETLVLYIFHLFHSSLNGPLAVLYKFLDYFSKFDWDNYCISLNGPVRISSLPEVVVETPENGGCDLLLSNEFLREHVAKFSVPTRGYESNSRIFLPKHLNIIDPLKENNNLGRSVSKGNFYRIRSAFTYGARKLGRILSQPEEVLADELHKFFLNTLARHGNGQRPDVQDPGLLDGQYGLGATFSSRGSCHEGHTILPESAGSISVTGECRVHHRQSSCGGVNVKMSRRELSFGRTNNETQNSANGTSVSENHLSGDAKDLVTSRIQGLLVTEDAPTSSALSFGDSIPSVGKGCHASQLYSAGSAKRNREIRNENPERKQPEISGFADKRVSSGILPGPYEETASVVCSDLNGNHLIGNREFLSPVESMNHPLPFSSVALSSDDLYPRHSSNWASASTAGSPDALNSLSDLSGDYESHLNSLLRGRICYEDIPNVPSMSWPLLTQFQGKNSWDVIRRSVQIRRNPISQMNVNGVVQGPVFYTVNPSSIQGAAFGIEEMPKPRGTGTYFPNTNHYRDRPLTPRGRNLAPTRSPRNNGRNSAFHETNLQDRNSRELSQAQFHFHQGSGKSGSSDFHLSGSPETKLYSDINGSLDSSEGVVESGSIGHQSLGPPSVENCSLINAGSALAQNSSVSMSEHGLQKSKLVFARDQDRIAAQSYHLKDEDDFPPLSDSSGKGLPSSTVKKIEQVEQ